MALKITLIMLLASSLPVQADNSTNITRPMPTTLPLMKMPMQSQSLLPLIMSQINMKTILPLLKTMMSQIPTRMTQNLDARKDQLPEKTFQCLSDINTYVSDLLAGKMWALSMFDATGKLGPSIMQGSLTFMGNFDQCLESMSPVNKTTGRKIQGDTCVVSLVPPDILMSAVNINETGPLARQILFQWHMCIPTSCDHQSLSVALQDTVSKVNMSVANIICHNDIKLGDLGHDPPAIGIVVLIAILGFMVVLGSSLDLYLRATRDCEKNLKPQNKMEVIAKPDHNINGTPNGVQSPGQQSSIELTTTEAQNTIVSNGTSSAVPPLRSIPIPSSQAPRWQRFLLCFSAVTNGEKILSVKRTPGSLTCLNGIRVLSMSWVILGHTMSFTIFTADNPRAYMSLMESFTFQTMLNGSYSVDSFFLLSGLLVTYLFLRETKKTGGVKPKQMVMYYVHRYLRLTPAYAFMIYVNTYLVGYLTDGPTWAGGSDKQLCQNNWWNNLLYVNNLVNSGSREQCVVWSWFLAIDMQLYIVAPLAILPFAFGSRRGSKMLKAVGVAVAIVFVFVHMTTTAYYAHQFGKNLMSGDEDFFVKIYIKPWCRIAPFAVGMLVAFFLHKTGGKIKMSPFLQVLGWLVSLAILLTLLLITFDEYRPNGAKWTPNERAAHEALSRPAWGLALAWLILMCCSNKGGILNAILSWDWWQPLSRLTYGAYLLHIIIIRMDTETIRTLVHYSMPYVVHRYFGYMCMSYLYSFLMALLVEAPFLNMEKLVLG